MNKIKIFCTLGPSSLNSKFLRFSNNNVDLLRLNMSHISLKNLKKNIQYIRKFSKVPICLDTEGAQIRTKIKKKRKFKINQFIQIKKGGNFSLYPENIINKLKISDILELGFDGLIVKVVKIAKFKNLVKLKVLQPGYLENNKGVHLRNRKIKIDFLTTKDKKAIEIAKNNNIKNYALSFTNSLENVKSFNKLLPKSINIFKLETLKAIQNFKVMRQEGKFFLIDRGDLSKDIKLEKVPLAQRYIQKFKKNSKIFIATNFLENMLEKPYPTRAEVNDIYNSLEMGANGLVLAAETAVGKYPIECVKFLKLMINSFRKNRKIV